MAAMAARSQNGRMTAALAVQHLQTRRPVPSRPPSTLRDVACWTSFAVAAVLFVLDAMTTIQVLAIQPLAMEQNPMARWTLDAHPTAPFILKAAIVAECAAVAGIVRAMHEGWAAYLVSAMMAGSGVVGIASAVGALIG